MARDIQVSNQQDGPPDLDEMFKKMVGGFKKKAAPKQVNGGNSGNSGSGTSLPKGGFWGMVGLAVLVLVIIWALSGIYIVQPAEQGVVLRFGKYQTTVGPGAHWYPRFIDSKYVVNTDAVRSLQLNELMLTSGENIVSVQFAVQYRIGSLKDYLFNVLSPEDSLRQIIDSAVREVIGTSKLDDILTTGRQKITQEVQVQIEALVKKYQNGIQIVDVKMQPAQAPEQVKAAFDDVIKAREDNQRLQNEADSYANKVVPVAEGRAKRILQQANAYKQTVIYQAQGAVAQFDALLPKYQMAPRVTKERMYIDAMQNVLAHSKVVLVDTGNNSHNLLYLPVMGQMGLNAHTSAPASSTGDKTASAAQQGVDRQAALQRQMALRNALIRWREAQTNAQ